MRAGITSLEQANVFGADALSSVSENSWRLYLISVLMRDKRSTSWSPYSKTLDVHMVISSVPNSERHGVYARLYCIRCNIHFNERIDRLFALSVAPPSQPNRQN